MPKRFSRLIYSTAGCLMLAGSITALGITTSTTALASTQSLTWGITSSDPSLDPGLVYAIDPNIVTAAMCNSLLQFGPTGQLEPELASSWKQTSPTSYVYNLVHNARFWDGHPVTVGRMG